MTGVAHDGARWSNAEEDRIVLMPYDAAWPARFEAEAARVGAALADAGLGAFQLEHVGSTAIPGLAAKPIVDILVLADELARWPHAVAPLEGLGYVYWADNPRRDRMFFVKGMPPFGTGRTHHVHVRTREDAREVIAFRDHLRGSPDAAREYERLKRELEASHPTDRDAYTAGKTRFVAGILARAAAGG